MIGPVLPGSTGQIGRGNPVRNRRHPLPHRGAVRFGERKNRWINIVSAVAVVAGTVFWGKADWDADKNIPPAVWLFGVGALGNLYTSVRKPRWEEEDDKNPKPSPEPTPPPVPETTQPPAKPIVDLPKPVKPIVAPEKPSVLSRIKTKTGVLFAKVFKRR